MADFSDFDNMLAEFFADFGFTATYLSTVVGTPDYTTGEIPSTVTEIPVQAIKMDLPRPTNGVGTNAGSLIQEGDQILYVRPTEKTLPLSPVLVVDPTSDRVRINGVEWKIVTLKLHSPNATDNVLYELYVRK